VHAFRERIALAQLVHIDHYEAVLGVRRIYVQIEAQLRDLCARRGGRILIQRHAGGRAAAYAATEC
jgi:hypothetical protein